MSERQVESNPPRAFISYSWDDEEHKAWVRKLAARLRADGIDVTLDRWELQPGDRLPAFMEAAIRDNDFVLIVCTPHYKERSDARRGGVGYEGDIMTGELLGQGNERKFIPVLRRGDATEAVPTWLSGKYYVDLRDAANAETAYQDLLTTLVGRRQPPPPLGRPPATGASGSGPRGAAATHAMPTTAQPPNTVPWAIEGQTSAAPSSGRDADGFAWKLRRGDETRSIVVWISRSAMASAESGLPSEVVQARRTNGRSVLGGVLGLDSPPGEVLVSIYGVRRERVDAPIGGTLLFGDVGDRKTIAEEDLESTDIRIATNGPIALRLTKGEDGELTLSAE